MKLFAAIVAVAAASTLLSHDDKKLCLCCLDGFQWVCCTACLLGGGDSEGKIAESLTAIQVITSKPLFYTIWKLKFRLIWMRPKQKPVVNVQCAIWLANTAPNAITVMVDVQLTLTIEWKLPFLHSKRSKSVLITIYFTSGKLPLRLEQ